MANRIAVSALRMPATHRIAIISTIPDQRENWPSGLEFSSVSIFDSCIVSIIHHVLKFFTSLNPCAIREISPGYGFSILRLYSDNFYQTRISTDGGERPLGDDDRSRF